MLNKPLLVLVLTLWPAWLVAQENLLTNPYTPYPPGCATNNEAMHHIPGREAEVTSGRLAFQAWGGFEGQPLGQFLDVDMTLIRRGCAESDRSLLILQLDVIDDGDEITTAIRLPFLKAYRFGVEHDLRGTSEPNSWGSDSVGGWLQEGKSVRLFLDTPNIADPDFEAERALTPEEYNGDWVLEISDPMWSAYRVDVPEYRNQLQASSFLINGRLSGIWWVPDSPDQGVYLGFHERANDDSGVVFFSWNTFGPNGENLWFSGTGDYEIGDGSVVIDMVWVTDGAFMGSVPAKRTPAGTVTLTANSCNDLTMQYDMDFPGLEDGVRRLVRPFGIETQGYACRDLQARQDTL